MNEDLVEFIVRRDSIVKECESRTGITIGQTELQEIGTFQSMRKPCITDSNHQGFDQAPIKALIFLPMKKPLDHRLQRFSLMIKILYS
jgi:hypothetical protein